MCIQVYTYVISYLLKKLPSYSLEHKPAIYNSMILVPTSSLILGLGGMNAHISVSVCANLKG